MQAADVQDLFVTSESVEHPSADVTSILVLAAFMVPMNVVAIELVAPPEAAAQSISLATFENESTLL